ncbi:MAG: RNA polymerase sigma factor [Woeseiaceae bacterium]|nr:RNA polymerase sigma factor [Woeseiaceae bacterium]
MGSDGHNDRTTFDALLRPHLERLFRFAYRLTASRAEAEDLFQDVLLKVYTRLDDLLDVAEPAPWLCRVMYNHFIDNRRRFARARLVSVPEGQLPGAGLDSLAGDLDPQRDAERLDNIMRLDRALAALSDEHRLVVLLHDAEGYKLQEIQQITGDPLGTIKSRLHRARARLRERLEKDGTKSAAPACMAISRK